MILSYEQGISFEKTRNCIKCCKKVRKHGLRTRVVREGAEKRTVLQQRYRCPHCRCVYTVMPPGVLPYMRYATSEILAEMKDTGSSETLAYDSTIYRWRKAGALLLVVYEKYISATPLMPVNLLRSTI